MNKRGYRQQVLIYLCFSLLTQLVIYQMIKGSLEEFIFEPGIQIFWLFCFLFIALFSFIKRKKRG